MWMHVVKPAVLVVKCSCLLLLETRRRSGWMSSLRCVLRTLCFSRTRRWS
ncbi:hypothetical protein M758_11G073200 [Ceratodon purpureus]|nr:hypothetical protein M758_11G073200 [Ceratodon purpureus]